jgi:ATP-dependent Lhr-like helicase
LPPKKVTPSAALAGFHAPVRAWFEASFPAPTPAQIKGWPPILAGSSALLFAPTGSGKTLAAFLAGIDRVMFSPEPHRSERCRILYVSPLKALAADVERNLRGPLAGIARVAGESGVAFRIPSVAIRSGDTPTSERGRIARTPPDILITTPESLYLLLTSQARSILASVDTVIVDEIHSLVPTKRGAHLFLSLERLEALRPPGARPLQRIGLSATQRPLDEVARLLGGGEIIGVGGGGAFTPRPVTIVDGGSKKAWDLRVEVPIEDMSRLGEIDTESAPAARGKRKAPPKRTSIWPSIHPRLVELIRAHTSTMIFANSRRLAERLASAINETAGEEIALAHHGSVARERRLEIEERLKKGDLPAIVATSSLELGIDIGAVDLVVQIEAPPSVASGLQRIGRAGHSVGAVSRGIIFPKYRGDLLAAAAVTARMMTGTVEETFYPRNPLDILAQQIVAIASDAEIGVDVLFALVRRAAPFAELPRGSFEGVLDMLSGRYPSDEFAELRPRLTWDRTEGTIKAREGAKRIAIINGGTIPDRGLYGVYLSSEETRGSRRVGELDEEMVFEARPGEVFLLGASSWRIDEITHDRVLVSPAPGQPGKMPFWHGDRPGRPPELGRAVGALARELAALPLRDSEKRLQNDHGLDRLAAQNLTRYLADQAAATGEVPSDRAIILERCLDELGDYRVCVLSPFGARVHAPWCTAVLGRLRAAIDGAIEGVWSDDGMVFRLPGADEPPAIEPFLPRADEIEDLVVRSLGASSIFAARFRENAGRALLLPKRRPGQRSPLWSTRKKAADLLAVASRFQSFPLILETYRECLRDVFDLPGLVDILRQIEAKSIRVLTVDSRAPSPFAASLLFSYVASFIYDGDAPVAERRAHALSIDTAELRELLGEANLSELLDPDAITETALTLQRLDGRRSAESPDGLHDLLLSLGDLSEAEIQRRSTPPEQAPSWIARLAREQRIVPVSVAGEPRFIAAEDAARLRDALGTTLPRGLPAALLEPVADPLGDLVARYARTHGPFLIDDLAARLGLGVAVARETLDRLAGAGRVITAVITPGRRAHEWCDAEVMRSLKRRSLAKLRREVEPVEPAALGRFLLEWHGLRRPRAGADGLLAVVEQLQGAPLPASVLEDSILPARIAHYRRGDLDHLSAAGEIVWMGIETLGPKDGRIALFLADQVPLLAPARKPAEGALQARLRALLQQRGALFFSDLVAETAVFPHELLGALWDLVWAGEVTNDTLAPLRSLRAGEGTTSTKRASIRGRSAFQPRRHGPPGSEGRWSLIARPGLPPASETSRRTALTRALLDRHGVLTREAVAAEGLEGGFTSIYDVLKAMEQSARVRRGYFVAGLGATQFALPGADDRLRACRDPQDDSRVQVLAATDPANPYGAALPWPEDGREGARPQRAAGAQVLLLDGRLIGYLGRTEKDLLTFLPDDFGATSRSARALAQGLAALVDDHARRTLILGRIDGDDPDKSPLGPHLVAAGFSPSSKGWFKRGATRRT